VTSTLNNLFIVLLVIHCFATYEVMAHPGHDHELTKEQAILRGSAVVSSMVDESTLVNGEVLGDSWKQASESATCKETPEFYLITIANRNVEKTIYILLTSTGKYLRANFDGHFADLLFSSYPVMDC